MSRIPLVIALVVLALLLCAASWVAWSAYRDGVDTFPGIDTPLEH